MKSNHSFSINCSPSRLGQQQNSNLNIYPKSLSLVFFFLFFSLDSIFLRDLFVQNQQRQQKVCYMTIWTKIFLLNGIYLKEWRSILNLYLVVKRTHGTHRYEGRYHPVLIRRDLTTSCLELHKAFSLSL